MSSEYRVPECDGDGAHRPIMMRWRSERNGFWCRRCNLVLAIDEITLQDQRRVTSHNAMRDALCTNYHTLPPLLCGYCGHQSCFPTADVVKIEHKVEIFGESRNYIADVAAFRELPIDLTGNGGLVAVIEVVDTNPPSYSKLRSQNVVQAFYLRPQSINVHNLHGYCSALCCQLGGWNRHFLYNPSFRRKPK